MLPTKEKNLDKSQKLKMEFSHIVSQYRKIATLEQCLDENKVVVEETLLVDSYTSKSCFSLRIVELRNIKTFLSIIYEVDILKALGLNKHIMGLFEVFRHRQYVGMLFPPYLSIRDSLDLRYYLKTNKFNNFKCFGEKFIPSKLLKIENNLGVSSRTSVVYVLRNVFKGLAFLNSKGYVHTQLSSLSVFVDDFGRIKLGNFLNVRKIGSKNWKFTGNPTFLPPEAFLEQNDLSFKTNFDVWSIGFFTIELITGFKTSFNFENAKKIAMKLLHNESKPPSLGEVDPNTIINNKQMYDVDIDSFVKMCLNTDYKSRAIIEDLERHPFINREINWEAGHCSWIMPFVFEDLNQKRSLYTEMFFSQNNLSDFNSELLLKVIFALNLTNNDFYPIFKKSSSRHFVENFIAVEAILAIQEDDADWSCDVLDVSQEQFDENDNLENKNQRETNTPDKTTRKPLPSDFYCKKTFNKSILENYQRVHTIFFIKKDWNKDTRILFLCLQFFRWYKPGILNFGDVIRVVDEIEDVVTKFVCSKKPVETYPSSVVFLSALRKSLINFSKDPDLQKYNHLYIEVALKKDAVAKMKQKFEKLNEDDPVYLPSKYTMLQVAVTYHNLNINHIEFLENLLLGKQRVEKWDYHPDQRLDDMLDEHTNICHLLEERRRNPILKYQMLNDNNTSEANNQARLAKIWSDYDRDYVFQFCKLNVPYKIDENDARILYGSPKKWIKSARNSNDAFPLSCDLEKQLLRTRTKLDEDFIYPFKYYDNIEARKAAITQLELFIGKNENQSCTLFNNLLSQANFFVLNNKVEILSPVPDSRHNCKRLSFFKKLNKLIK